MISIKLTSAQRSAVVIYVVDVAHAEDYPEATLSGSTLRLDCTPDRAAEILIDAANSADDDGGGSRDPGSFRALCGVLAKLRAIAIAA